MRQEGSSWRQVGKSWLKAKNRQRKDKSRLTPVGVKFTTEKNRKQKVKL